MGASFPGVQKISVMDFEKIWYGTNRDKYQIIDVRERCDFMFASGDKTDIINLPLSKSYKWSSALVMGNFLDRKRPIMCVCLDGQRSAIMSSFLGKYFLLSYAYFLLILCYNHFCFYSNKSEISCSLYG